MHTKKTFRWAVVLLLLVSIGLSGCASQKKPIRIAISAWAGVEPAELAAQLGYYEKYGVDVEIVRFSAYSDSLEALRDDAATPQRPARRLRSDPGHSSNDSVK